MSKLEGDSFDYSETAKLFGVSHSSVYSAVRLRDRINPKTGKPFSSLTEYQKHLAEKNRERKVNRELGDLIRISLKVLERNRA